MWQPVSHLLMERGLWVRASLGGEESNDRSDVLGRVTILTTGRVAITPKAFWISHEYWFT